MSSAFKNAFKAARRDHKERGQLSSRKHLGLLEKKKDYRQRADNYHRKQDQLRVLQNKAKLRNADEFYHGMIKKKTRGGVHVAEGNNTLSGDVIKLLKTQDSNYVGFTRSLETNGIDKLTADLHLMPEADAEQHGSDDDDDDEGKRKRRRRKQRAVGAPSHSGGGTHTLFVDSKKEARNFSAAEYFDTAPELVGRAFNRPRMSTLGSAEVAAGGALGGTDGQPSKKQLAQMDKVRARRYEELSARINRKRELEKAKAGLDVSTWV